MDKMVFDHPNFGKLVLRLGIGIPMLLHGIHKLRFGIEFIVNWFVSLGLPTFLSYGVYLGEVIAPFLIITGLFVRTASVLFAGNMIVALLYLSSQGYEPFSLGDTGGFKAELNLVFLFSAIALFFLGSGKFNVFNIKKNGNHVENHL